MMKYVLDAADGFRQLYVKCAVMRVQQMNSLAAVRNAGVRGLALAWKSEEISPLPVLR